MRRPPDKASNLSNGITGTRTKAEIRRELADRFNAAARRSGVTLMGWQVRTLIASALANDDEPTDEQLMRTLMAAPWFPKPTVRKWRVGEGGGWAVRS